jgi:predicted ATPase
VPSLARLQVRVGIATGAVVVGDVTGTGATQEPSIIGETPNLAARLQGLAEPGMVVIAGATRRLVGGLFDCAALGRSNVKGYAEPVEAWSVTGESGSESRFAARHRDGLTPLVGREDSLALLLDRWRLARRGEGQVVLLSGEPGIGKSRIIEAMRERMADQSYTHLRYSCSPHWQDSALHPFVAQIERAAGIARGDPPEGRLDKLERLLDAWAGTRAAAPLFAALLSIPPGGRYAPLNLTPQRQKEKTLQALVDLLANIAGQRPVLMIVDDVHWLDPTSIELLDALVGRTKDLSLMLILSFRQEFAPPWSGHAHVGALPLGRLNRKQSTDLVARVAGGKLPSEEVIGEIVGRAEGVPLFVEELTKAVLESGAGIQPGNRSDAGDRRPPATIPFTLHDSLMARLDRVPSAKEAAQIGAIIGREFAYRVLAAVAGGPENSLRLALDRLVAGQLLFRRGTYPEATFSFKHALIQDAAYQSLLRGKRQVLHARTAIALEEQYPELTEDAPELIAHHCARGGLPEKAADLWRKAARNAAARSSHVESIAHLQRALEALALLPDGPERAHRELKICIAMGVSLQDVKSPASAETLAVYERARALSETVGDAGERFAVLWGLWRSHRWRSDVATARRLVEELIEVAERERNPALLLQARHAQWTLAESSGSLMETLDCVRSGLAIYDPAARESEFYWLSGHDPAVCGYGSLAHVSWLLGYPERAIEYIDDALRLARQLGHPPSLANALVNALDLYLWRGDAMPLRDLAEQLIALAEEQRFADYLSRGKFVRGWAMVLQEHAGEGIVRMNEALATLQGAHRDPYWRALLIEAHRMTGRVTEALKLTDSEFQRDVDEWHERWLAAEVARLIGEALAAGGRERHAAAEAKFQVALDIARRQGAKSLELRAATSLARLWRVQGHAAQAFDLLAPVFDWFTEGSETPDLKEARSLLGALK